MHERMKPITELVKHSTNIKIIIPTLLLDKEEKKEAIEYLKNDDEIEFEINRLNAEDTIIEIKIKQTETPQIICNFCEHEAISNRRLYCKLTNELIIFPKESCDDFKEMKIGKIN